MTFKNKVICLATSVTLLTVVGVIFEIVAVRMIVRRLVEDSSTPTLVAAAASLVVMFSLGFKALADTWTVLRRMVRTLS